MPVERNERLDRCILWRRLDQPGYDWARLFPRGSTWQLHGTAVFAHDQHPCRLDYRVACNSLWQTLSARVAGWSGKKAIKVELVADSASRWRFNGKECAAVAGCIDVDLSFSPATNLLPIRRLRLAAGSDMRARAAWLRFPELTLEPLEQTYRRLDDRTYRYESAGGEFVTELVVDDAGLVTRYPGFWQSEATA